MNGVTTGNMEELKELTLPGSSKPNNIVNNNCHSSTVNKSIVNDNSANYENNEDLDCSGLKDIESNSDEVCDEKIIHTEMNNIPEKFDNSINLIDKNDHENSEHECAEEVVSLNSKVLNGDHGNGSIENCETKNNEIDLLQKQHEENTQSGSVQSVASPAVEEILSNDDKCEIEINSKNDSTGEQIQLHCKDICEEPKECENVENPDTYKHGQEDMSVNLLGIHKTTVVKDANILEKVATKQMKAAQSSSQKKKPTVVFIDKKSGDSNKFNKISINSNASVNAQILFQSIMAGGASITPICSKTNSVVQKSSSDVSRPTANQHILPSLTDDMFVVEAPSFIVPYVYEKPSITPFKDYVDLLGKELERLLYNKEKNETDVKKELLDGYDQSENKDAEEIKKDEQCNTKDENIKQDPEDEKKVLKKRRRKDDDDASWDGESSTDLDEDVISDKNAEDKTVIMKGKTKPDENLINVSGLGLEKVLPGKPNNYFDCSLGTFFIDIGLNLVQEFVQNDLLKEQNRKLNREKKVGHNTRATESSIASLTNNLELSKINNAPYQLKQHKCSLCSFKTDSQLVLAHHMETPHIKNNVYKCNYCTFEVKSPHDILHHMEAAHKIQGKLERTLAYHQCANCPFEDNGKGKLARHQISCAKKFKPDLNLAPPFDWEPPAKIPKTTRSRNSLMGPYPSAFHRSITNSPIRAARVPGTANTTVQRNGGCVKVGGSLRVSKCSPTPTASRVVPIHGTSMIRGGVMRNTASLLLPVNPVTTNCKNVGSIKSLAHQQSISDTPLPRQSRPPQPQPAHQSKNTFVICEICDGYIKDLEQLRNHMQWIHKVKIHPKMIYNKPPLNCQKCRCRFFTDQGLERHLLGSHGLVTSSMQHAANMKSDAGRCPVCGRVYQWKLLNHVSRDHNLTLKPAHLTYKCTVCTATFAMYKEFESHVYSVHSVVAKCVMDKGKVVPKKPDSLLKPLKINDEITIIPSPDKD